MTAVMTVNMIIGENNQRHGEQSGVTMSKTILPVTCPYCEGKAESISTWGSYRTNTGEVIRFCCKKCHKTFNPAKVPCWKDKVIKIITTIAELTIKEQLSVSALARIWSVPESSIRRLVNAIKTFLADNFELIKQLQEFSVESSIHEAAPLRVIYYDEGFLKFFGATGFLIFVLDDQGRPISIDLESDRKAKTIYSYFVQAMTQLGGLDVIVADGSPAILAAARALRQPIKLVQHIHRGKGKRVRIVAFQPIPNRKAIWETTIELHGNALLPDTESLISVNKKKIYPASWSSTTKKPPRGTTSRKSGKEITKRTGVLTPEESIISPKQQRKRSPRLLSGYKVYLRTGPSLQEFELSYISTNPPNNSQNCPSLIEIHQTLSIVQMVFPNQSITSNRAEVFNSLHDRVRTYRGRKSLIHGSRDLRAWVALTFYPEGSYRLLKHRYWSLPYRLLTSFCSLIISRASIS